MQPIYLCIDLKTFYASVECVERGLNPFETDLVIADPSRSKGAICLAISPKMKARGIHNRCRIWEIPKNIKPIVAKPRMKLYMKYSAWVYTIYLKYVSKDDIHPYSIDEMFLDVTHYLPLYSKTPEELARMIMTDIFQTTGLTATAGIGTNLYLAKVALDITAKHVDSHIGYLDEQKYQRELWHHVPLTDFWRISHGTEARLHKLHLKDMYDVAHADEKKLYQEFGINAQYLIDHAWGIEPCTISDIKKYQPQNHSLTSNQILYQDYNCEQTRVVLQEMIDQLVLQLVEKKYCTNIIGFSIGYSKEIVPTTKVSFKLEQPTDRFSVIVKRVLEEYDYRVSNSFPIRRISVYFGNICPRKYEQIDLFSSLEQEEKEENLENTVLEIHRKFGKNSLLRAMSYTAWGTQRDRNRLIGGHNAE